MGLFIRLMSYFVSKLNLRKVFIVGSLSLFDLKYAGYTTRSSPPSLPQFLNASQSAFKAEVGHQRWHDGGQRRPKALETLLEC